MGKYSSMMTGPVNIPSADVKGGSVSASSPMRRTSDDETKKKKKGGGGGSGDAMGDEGYNYNGGYEGMHFDP